MGKRTHNIPSRPHDFWPTPPEAAAPLLPYLSQARYVLEPCAGDGALLDVLKAAGVLVAVAFDIAPRRADIRRGDASKVAFPEAGLVVTNPPWSEALLTPILANLIGRTDAWLLLPLDYAANLWTNPVMQHVDHILPLGRVSWMHNGKGGTENSAWFRFRRTPQGFIGTRVGKKRQ